MHQRMTRNQAAEYKENNPGLTVRAQSDQQEFGKESVTDAKQDKSCTESNPKAEPEEIQKRVHVG